MVGIGTQNYLHEVKGDWNKIIRDKTQKAFLDLSHNLFICLYFEYLKRKEFLKFAENCFPTISFTWNLVINLWQIRNYKQLILDLNLKYFVFLGLGMAR